MVPGTVFCSSGFVCFSPDGITLDHLHRQADDDLLGRLRPTGGADQAAGHGVDGIDAMAPIALQEDGAHLRTPDDH